MNATFPADDVVVVAVVTYKRPDQLRQTLGLVTGQIRAAAPATHILVVDNDAEGSAGPVVRSFGGPHVHYAIEPSPGIAAARNAALAAAIFADVLIFIDDDERPTENWLSAMLATFAAYRPAAVVGPVASEFDGPLDGWIAQGGFFERRRLATGTSITVAATNNLLLDLRRIRKLGLTFDARFGLSGGSDTLFTRQLSQLGGVMVWCAEAMVIDVVSSERATRRWVLLRAMRYGNSWSRTTLAMVGRRSIGVVLHLTARGVSRVGFGIGRYVFGIASRSVCHRARGLRTAMNGTGLLLGAWGHAYQEYGRPKSAVSVSQSKPAP